MNDEQFKRLLDNLSRTPKGGRVMSPEFGSDLKGLLFESTPLIPRVQSLYKFGKASGFSLAESCILFFQDELFAFPTSIETKALLDDIQEEKSKKLDYLIDSEDRKIHDIVIELLDMLLMNSLEKDLQGILEKYGPSRVGEKHG